MKKLLAILLLLPLPTFAQDATVTQYSLFDALLGAVYDGEMTVSELKQYGDFGIGTFNQLDGEMVVLDGHFYQTRADGAVVEMKKDEKTPFATLAFFKPEKTVPLESNLDLPALAAVLDKQVQAKPNLFYTIRIDGVFSSITFRAPHAQKKPYPPIIDAIEKQAVFKQTNAEGTLVGFRSPSFAHGLNVPAYHFHFLSKDKKSGGHVLAVMTGVANASFGANNKWQVIIPENEEFQRTDFSIDRGAQLNATMKGKAK